MTQKVIAAALGNCVHVAGLVRFLRIAESCGWECVFLGPAVSIERVLQAIEIEKPDLVAVSYRLTPETGERLLSEFAEATDHLREEGIRFAFGGTPPLAAKIRQMNFFEAVFEGGERPDLVANYLQGNQKAEENIALQSKNVIERINKKKPYPILRHHFGLPDYEATRQGIHEIAEAGVLDVISLGVDQDTQENFFHPERQVLANRGAGGVPVRSPEEFRRLYAAAQTGNFPLLRSYSGTDDFIQMAEVLTDTIQNAWCAIPLFWFNQMDGRGPWDLKGSIEQHQEVMRWYGYHHIPVELNESHHWGMRDASDVIFVVSAFLAAYNARAMGVNDYIAQMMLNSPFGTSDAMDLAKMLAIKEMILPLQNDTFQVWIQTRTGLLSYPTDPAEAMGHLASSVYVQMALAPDIVHVVSYSEAHHAATAADVITSCKIAHRVIDNFLQGAPDFSIDPQIQSRKAELIKEAEITLQAIRHLAPSIQEPWTDAAVLTKAVTSGILDAPQLISNPYALGVDQTRIMNGRCVSVNRQSQPIKEDQRIVNLNRREL